MVRLLFETIFACSYCFTGGRLDAYTLFWVNQGLYNLGDGSENIQEGEAHWLKAKGAEMPL